MTTTASRLDVGDDVLDRAGDVRERDRVDTEVLSRWLAAHAPRFAGPITVAQFPGGYSNVTYELRGPGLDWVLRRAPLGVEIKSAHDMKREARVLEHLARVWHRAPRVVVLCDDASVLGTPFYVMERVRGVVLRKVPPAGLVVDATAARALSGAVIDVLAEIHALDVAAAGLSDLGRPAGYVARQVRGWSDRWQRAKTDEVPEIDALASWLEEHQPPEDAPSLVHNDLKHDNLVLDPADLSRVLAVLDWEMATLGDPRSDLGTTLSYWIDADDPEELREHGFGLSPLPGSLTRSEAAARWQERTGRDISPMVFFYVLAMFKTAVIGQQLYARYRKGLTTETKYATLGETVRVYGRIATRALDRNRIDRLV